MNANSHKERDSVEKYDMKLKSKHKDGIILQLHHTVRGSDGECRRIRFTTGTFDDANDMLACADNLGNLFLLNFSDLKFWKLPGIGPCSALHFASNIDDTLIIATSKKIALHFLDIENGNTSMTLKGHTAPIKHISFSNNKMNNLLTSSAVEAILWELNNYTKYFTLNTFADAQIQQIMFTPASDYLVACLQNDTVQIWKHENMKSVKQIIPNELKHMKSIAFTMNGRAMAMAGLSVTLILFSMDTWKALMSIDLSKYNISGVQMLSFIPQLFDGGSNKILGILSSDCVLHVFDLDALCVIHSLCTETSYIRKFVVSNTGKYFLCVLQQGEVNIYKSSYVLEISEKIKLNKIKSKPTVVCSINKIVKHRKSNLKSEVQEKMKTCMDSARLRRILMQYGEYPEKFRSVIWSSLLNTPKNKQAYMALVDMGIHPAYKDIEKLFTIHSASTLKSLKRLLSCLAHWCPLFAVMKFLPGFIFPFVKVLQKDPLQLFECVATVLINYCQLWFEYAPFPPISVLAIIENILGEHDRQLLEHFCLLGATSQTYALKILETAFSEVLTCSEWLILWDHVFSNEPAFFLMTVVSYNTINKNVIKKIKTIESLEKFFHTQSPVDKKIFLKKAYIMLDNTPKDLHPRSFFHSFVSLEKGDSYQQFTGYPKATICLKLAKKIEKTKSEKQSLKDLVKKAQEKEIKLRQNKETFGHNEKKFERDKDNSKCIVQMNGTAFDAKSSLLDSEKSDSNSNTHQNKSMRSTKTKEYKTASRVKVEKKYIKNRESNVENNDENLVRCSTNSDNSDT